MRKEELRHKLLRGIYNYLMFFLLVAFLVSCSMLLFINVMAEELSGVETLRTDFIANVSHEMKKPLSVMQNYGTLLQMPDLEESKRMEYAKGVAEGSRRLADMMTNILKLNKLEKQQIYPKTEEYDLGE